MPAKKTIAAAAEPLATHAGIGRDLSRNAEILPVPVPVVKMTADIRSMSVAQLQRAIRRIAACINRCASMDELDHAWATLCRLHDALALATERAKALAD
jgi:hypothetical protein